MSVKRFLINLTSKFVNFIVSVLIQFLLTPYIVSTLGSDAYGFVSLANNFASYTMLVAVGINSVAGVFIAEAFHQDDKKSTNEYFNSVFVADLFIAGFITLVSQTFVIFMDCILNIPEQLVTEVKLLFFMVFLNCGINIAISVFSTAAFTKNRLDLSSFATLLSELVRVIILFGLIFLVEPRISFYGISVIFSTVVLFTCNFLTTKIIMPELKFNLKMFNIISILEIFRLGVWKLINSLGNILLTGLDLLIANIAISASAMGTLSFTKMLPSLTLSMITMISGIFVPTFLKNYVQQDKEVLIKNINISIRIVGFFIAILVPVLTAFGKDFFKLWLPSQDAGLLQFISIIILMGTAVSGIVSPLVETFMITKKMKAYSFILLGSGIANTISVLILLHTTNLGIYAIAGVSVILEIFRSLIFVPNYSAKILALTNKIIYGPIVRVIMMLWINLIACFLLNKIYHADSWIELIIKVTAGGMVTTLVNLIFIFNKNEKLQIKQAIIHKMNHSI